MRRKLLFVLTASPGFILLASYLYYDYREYGMYFIEHLYVGPFYSTFFHVLIFTTPLVSVGLAYMLFDRLRLMAEKNASETKYRDYYDNAPYGYHSADPDMNILDVNKTWLSMLGYERDEIVGKRKVTDLVTEGSANNLWSLLDSLKKTGKLDDLNVDFIRKDGSVLPVVLTSSGLYDSDGRYLRSRTIIKDNTDRKAFEQILRGVAEHWEETFNSMPWGVMILDSNCQVLRYNKYFEGKGVMSPRKVATEHCCQLVSDGPINMDNPDMMLSLEFDDHETQRHYALSGKMMFSDSLVRNYVFNLIDITDLKRGRKKLEDSRNAFFNMLKDASAAYKELDQAYRSMMLSFVNAIDAKSPWTKGHSERVAKYALVLGKRAGLDRKTLDLLETAALLHDIGKIGTYDYLLEKSEGLTSEEYEMVKMHPTHSASILGPLAKFSDVVDIVKYHHENCDGTGYPEGLKGEDIPFLARIVCIADAYDSMVADRPYRTAQSMDYAIAELTKCSGTHFDPKLADMFIELINEGKV